MSLYALLQIGAIGSNLFVLGLAVGRWRVAALHWAALLSIIAPLGWATTTLFSLLSISQGHETTLVRVAALFWIP
ncbi:MAG TPA: hypothetical protein PLJ27_04695, partial [Polyangiaceae bacterium]|nr:hypothetical protein [Polyangiaceae bacterium]